MWFRIFISSPFHHSQTFQTSLLGVCSQRSGEEDGHVEDDDAADIDFSELLDDMRSDEEEINAARREAGYSAAWLEGWAEPPHYDAAEKKLYWAKDLRFEGEEVNTLNYNVRILGRRGVLIMNAVADIDELAEVAEGSKEILARTEFTAGNTYADFDPDLDKVAAYGIGGLIAGKVLLKAGFFKVILAFLAKGWKLIAIACVFIAGVAGKIFKGRQGASA